MVSFENTRQAPFSEFWPKLTKGVESVYRFNKCLRVSNSTPNHQCIMLSLKSVSNLTGVWAKLNPISYRTLYAQSYIGSFIYERFRCAQIVLHALFLMAFDLICADFDSLYTQNSKFKWTKSKELFAKRKSPAFELVASLLWMVRKVPNAPLRQLWHHLKPLVEAFGRSERPEILPGGHNDIIWNLPGCLKASIKQLPVPTMFCVPTICYYSHPPLFTDAAVIDE